MITCQSGPSGINPSGIMKAVEDILKGVAKLNLKKKTKEDIYRTMRDFKDLLKRTSKDMQGMRIQAQKTGTILDDIDFLLAWDSPQVNATPRIKSRVADLTFALKEGSSQATIAGLDKEWKTMQDRLKNCAKTVEAEEKGTQDMWWVIIAGAGIVLGPDSIALIGKIVVSRRSEATETSNAVVSGLETMSENTGRIDTLLHKLEKKDTELAIQCLDDAESAQLRGCMERFKRLTAETKSVLSEYKDDIMKCEAELKVLTETFDRTVLPGAVVKL